MANLSRNSFEKVLISAVRDNRAIELRVAGGANRFLTLVGSTVPSSAHASYCGDHVVLYPQAGKEGIVALHVEEHSASGNVCRVTSGFALVSWKSGDEGAYPFIDLVEPWIPTERMGQVNGHYLEVTFRSGRRLSTKEHDKSVTHVPDADMLCRYLYGEVSWRDVFRTIAKKKREESRLKTYKREVQNLNTQVQELRGHRDQLCRALDTCQQDKRERDKSYNDLRFELTTVMTKKSSMVAALRSLEWLYRIGRTLGSLRPRWLSSFMRAVDIGEGRLQIDN